MKFLNAVRVVVSMLVKMYQRSDHNCLNSLISPETSSRVAYVMAQYEVHSALTAVSVLIGAMFDGLAADNTDKPNRLHPSYLMLSKYDI